ncbi:MAG: signal peptidase II, partial [Oscillospiraceae bacterium]
VAASLIIGGGIGNLIDRIFNNGLVVDFIDFRIINFAIFNFADICAVCGAALLFIMVVIDEVRDNKKKRLEKAAVNADNGENGNAPVNIGDNTENGNTAGKEAVNAENGDEADNAAENTQNGDTADNSKNGNTAEKSDDGND